MQPDLTAARTILFVNIAHALDHFLILIFPTAVIAIAAERGLAYAELIGLATGTFLAFGLLSLPIGWVADRVGRRNLLAAFFVGSGFSCVGLAFATTPLAFAALLLVLGCFAAIYHPVGSAMIVSNASRLGRELGRNGVWGNLGAALASGVTALIAAQLGWRAAFAIPGLVAIGVGALFLAQVPSERGATRKPPGETAKTLPVANPLAIATLYLLAVVAGGVTFNVVTIALPKVIDERLGFALPLSAVGALATSVFILGALTQLAMGRLVDRIELPKLFVGLSLFQPLGLALATVALGAPMLVGMVLAMASIYGQVVLNDAMIARYVAPHLRAKAFGLRYFLGFGVSGLAVPMIAVLHGLGGFPAVLGVTAAFGATIFVSAIGFLTMTRPAKTSIPAGAE
ncbi:MAG: MFS transporter [Propylenella sp.]